MIKKILVTGGTGLVGRSLKDVMPDAIYISSKDFDIRHPSQVHDMFKKYKPTHVVHLAAIVSGISNNMKYPYDHFTDNIFMNTTMIEAANHFKCKMFIGMLSTCIYPDVSNTYPLKESQLLDGKPTPTNFEYAYSKRAMAVQIDACNKQKGTNFSYMIPANLYGIYDKYNYKSHYVAALIKKIYEAKKNGDKSIKLMGDGTPIRQFIYAHDLAIIIKYFIENEITQSINIAPDENYTISQIAEIALMACDASQLKIEFDSNFPNGQLRKDADNYLLKSIMPDFKFTSLYDGIQKTFRSYSELNK